MIPRHCLSLTLLFAFAALVPAQKPTSLAQTAKENGAYRTTFETPRGKIKVYLPDDMAAGDTISGTVSIEPSGRAEQERQRNSAVLNGYVVALENQKAPLSGGVIQRVSLAQSASLNLILLDAKGKQIAVSQIRLAPAAQTPTTSGFSLPTLGQTGRAVQLQGPFDGDSANTSVKIGGTDAKVLAESPRKLVVASPENVIGPTEISVNENGTAATGPFRNLKIDLTAPRTSLLKGESTELHVQVSGLEGISEPVKVELQNQMPSTVNVAGGNTQNIVIAPAQVQSGGTFPWATNLTGTGSGSFKIEARVTTTPPAPVPPTHGGTGMPSPSPKPTASTPPSTAAQTMATATPTPAVVTTQPSGPTILPIPAPADNFDGTFTKAATDCCKKFLDNGGISFLDGNGNGFKLDKNALIMFVDGQRYEWLFTQDGQPFPIAWMFCHLNDHQIISQLTNVMVQRVAGGNTNERSNTISVSLAGPYRSEKSSRPFYGFQFGAQKVGAEVKEYAVGFSMDAATCTWSWRLLADGKVREFTTQPAP